MSGYAWYVLRSGVGGTAPDGMQSSIFKLKITAFHLNYLLKEYGITGETTMFIESSKPRLM
jgi:hypothetical protein